MKPSIFPSTPLLVVVLFCIASCGGQNSNKSSDTMTTTDSATTMTSTDTTKTTTPATMPATSTIVTTAQDMMVVRHRVSNFNKWLTVYEAGDSMRLANGIHNYVVSRGLKDSNMVQVTDKVDDLTKARAFAKSPGLKQAMQKSGVVGAPMISFATMTYQDTANINSDLRSRVTLMVKDWDRWQRTFDSTRQMRNANGITDRAYGHDASDNHKVVIVVALTDSAKASAFWKSDQLKKTQAASGMVGQPDRFIYRIVKKY